MTATINSSGIHHREFFESAPRVQAGFVIPQQGCDADVISVRSVTHMWVHQAGDDWMLDVGDARGSSWTIAAADNEAGCYQYLHVLLCAINADRRLNSGVLS